MQPVMHRALPSLLICAALACDTEPKSQPATDASKAADATKSGADAKVAPLAKPEPADSVAKPEPSNPIAKLDPVATPEPAKPVPPRTALFFRDAPKGLQAIWALPELTAPDPTAARDLGLVTSTGGGSVAYGTSGPVLAGDGQWLAFLDEGRLDIARVDGTARHRITKHPGTKVEVLISGFTPDSTALLFHQGEVQTEEGAALPKDVVPGFQLLSLADQKLEPKTSLEAFTTFTHDGTHVIFPRTQPDRSTTLIRFDLGAGAEVELQKTADPYGFSQLTLHGNRIAYGRNKGKEATVVTDDLAGGKLVEIATGGTFAQFQWPHFSTDGQHVSYTDETKLMVRGPDDEAPRALTTCTQRHCDHAWDSASTLLVLDSGELSRVTLDGTTTALASKVVGFVVAGAPG